MPVIDVVKSIYRKIANKKNDKKSQSSNMRKALIEDVLSIVLNDPKFSGPAYIHGMNSKKQAELFGNTFPLQYIWNEYSTSEGDLGFSFSINGSVIGRILEQFIPRTNPNFNGTRDEILHLLHSMGLKVTQKIISSAQAKPSQIFKQYDFLLLVQSNYLAANIVNYNGDFVTRQLVEEAIDFMISLEPIDSSSPNANEEYKSNKQRYQHELSKTKQIFKKFGEQITPLTLENMQEVFYSITKSEKYSSSMIYHSVAHSCLESNWDKIGPWQK